MAGVKVENFIKKLIDMEENDQIVSYTDRSKDTINITVRFKRGVIKGWREQEALDFFCLKDKVTERIVVERQRLDVAVSDDRDANFAGGPRFQQDLRADSTGVAHGNSIELRAGWFHRSTIANYCLSLGVHCS